MLQSKMSESVKIQEDLYLALLGRALNPDEKNVIEKHYQAHELDLKKLATAIVDSDEFFNRMRERFAYRLFPKSTIVVGFGPMGHELMVDLRQFHMGFATVGGHYEVAESRFVQKFIKPRMSVVDIGANIGFFTTMFASLVGPAGHVTAFEPVTETYMRLQAAVRRNHLDHVVNLYNAAASNEEGYAEISYPKDCTNMGGVSISHEGKSVHEIKERIRTLRLDDELSGRPIDFIKIDVEGAELLAIQGAEAIIAANKPTIMMEFNSEQLAHVSQITSQALYEKMIAFGYTAKVISWEGDLVDFNGDFSPAVMNLVFVPI